VCISQQGSCSFSATRTQLLAMSLYQLDVMCYVALLVQRSVLPTESALMLTSSGLRCVVETSNSTISARTCGALACVQSVG
jgi:hypothetical protein